MKYLLSFWMTLASLCASASTFPSPAELPAQTNLPNPLLMLDGEAVQNAHDWNHHRAPELKALFEHYIYGVLPPSVKVRGKVTYVNTNYMDGAATLKLVTVRLGKYTGPEVHLMLVIPNHRSKRAPVFLGMNFSGNFSLVTDPRVPLPTNWMPARFQASEAGRGSRAETWVLDQTIARGYAVATYECGDIEQDRTNAESGVQEVIHAPKAADDWGTIAAWAWGLERMMDYLEHDKDIDAKRIALVGHSRFGKAAVFAGAMDDRAALVIPLQAGTGGTAPSRNTSGESVKQINAHFPAWFDGVFKEFNDSPERLPVDQNCLIALCAPRPVLLGAAVQDTEANPAGTFNNLKSASAVYRLLGTDGLAADHMPAVNTLVDSTLGFYISPGKHSMTREDWKVFLDFADKHLAK